MQQLITIPVIDSISAILHMRGMHSHDEILAEMIRQIEAKIFKQNVIAAKLGIAPARVKEMMNGKRRIQPGEMAPLAKLLGMATDRAPILSINSSPSVPYFGKIAAGVWLEESWSDPDHTDTVPFDRLPGDPGAHDLFAVQPEGDSMDLKWPSPVYLIFRRVKFGFADVSPGNYVLVERENHDLYEMTCKRLEIDADTGDFLLVSESSNPKYSEPIRVRRSPEEGDHVDNGICIIGKLVRAIQDYERN